MWRHRTTSRVMSIQYIVVLVLSLFLSQTSAVESILHVDCRGSSFNACDSIEGRRTDDGDFLFRLDDTGTATYNLNYKGGVNVYLRIWPLNTKVGDFDLDPRDSDYCTLCIVTKDYPFYTKVEKCDYTCDRDQEPGEDMCKDVENVED